LDQVCPSFFSLFFNIFLFIYIYLVYYDHHQHHTWLPHHLNTPNTTTLPHHWTTSTPNLEMGLETRALGGDKGGTGLLEASNWKVQGV
jgi:hypothetical protein